MYHLTICVSVFVLQKYEFFAIKISDQTLFSQPMLLTPATMSGIRSIFVISVFASTILALNFDTFNSDTLNSDTYKPHPFNNSKITLSEPSCRAPESKDTPIDWFSCGLDQNVWYGITKNSYNFTGAFSTCAAFGGELAVINSEEVDAQYGKIRLET